MINKKIFRNITNVIFITFCLNFISSGFVQAQNYTTKSKKAVKNYENALKAFENRDTSTTYKEINNAIKADANFIEAWLLLADLFHEKGEIENEIFALKKAVKINADFFIMSLYVLAKAELSLGRYQDALIHFQEFAKKTVTDSIYIADTQKKINQCKFAVEAIKNKVAFHLIRLGNEINTKFNEYWPSITADEQTLIFTRFTPIDTNNYTSMNDFQEDFFISKKVNNKWTQAQNMGAPMNTAGNEGAQSISADGKTMVFTACNRQDGLGKCDLYISYKTGNEWTVPVNMGSPVNSQHWESQPSLSPDGRTIYFVSSRSGGKGKLDIWRSFRQDNGKWSVPENLGDSINTSDDENAPFIHPDNRTLYFSSKGWLGFGGFDLFVSKCKTNNTWSTPENLGFPVNSNKDEVGLIVNAKGNLAMLSSNRTGKTGNDIYEFELDSRYRPQTVTYFKGTIFDAETDKKLKAYFELIDLETGEITIKSYSDGATGEFLVCLPVNKNYALNVSATGYLFHSENFSLKNTSDSIKIFERDIPLYPIRKGEKIILNNIFFETDSYILKSESNVELEKLTNFLKKNQTLQVEISGHTDNEGTAEHNKILSENRAKAVVEFLINHQISSKRLTYKGYGFTQPIADNATPEGRAKNRRTEMCIISGN